jgi:hypothetical protein
MHHKQMDMIISNLSLLSCETETSLIPSVAKGCLLESFAPRRTWIAPHKAVS